MKSHRLLIPVITPIARDHTVRIFLRVSPGGIALLIAAFINNPLPRNNSFFAGFFEQAINSLHIQVRHRRIQTSGEQLVSDAAASDRLRGFRGRIHRPNQIDGFLCPASTLGGIFKQVSICSFTTAPPLRCASPAMSEDRGCGNRYVWRIGG